MPKWSKQAKRIFQKYRAYKKKVKNFSEKYGIENDPLSLKEYKQVLETRKKAVEEGKRKSVGSIDYYLIQTEERPQVLYQRYLETFDKRVAYMEKRGLVASDGEPKKYDEFVQAYNEYKSDLKKEVLKGERTQIGNIVSRMVSDQVYDMSSEQYEATIQAVQEWNATHPDSQVSLPENFNPNSIYWQMQIRQGDYLRNQGWWDMIAGKRADLFKKYAKDPNAKEKVRKEISRIFYGSP